jgi:GT2 family glycosyltransferase
MSDAIDKLIGIVVLYNTSIKESKTITSINEGLLKNTEILELIVYDNSTQSEIKDGSIFSVGHLKIHYFHDPSNPGVSKAYNFASRYALQLKKRWILLLDQDTTFPIDAISTYIAAIKDYPAIKLFAPVLSLSDGRIVSPSRYFCKRGFALKNITSGVHSLKNISPINSGILIDLDAFTICGGYNEKVKLDFSDFQFIERFKRNFNQFCVLNIIALHEFSNAETNTEKLNQRFVYYCDGAKNSERNTSGDWLKYFIVVLVRATSLVYRTKNIVFFKTFIYHYLRRI